MCIFEVRVICYSLLGIKIATLIAFVETYKLAKAEAKAISIGINYITGESTMNGCKKTKILNGLLNGYLMIPNIIGKTDFAM